MEAIVPRLYKPGLFTARAKWTSRVYNLLRYRFWDFRKRWLAEKRRAEVPLDDEAATNASSGKYALSGELMRGAVVALTGSHIEDIDNVTAYFREHGRLP